MERGLAELRPTSLWTQFDRLTAVPRASKQEQRVRAWVLEWARSHGFDTREDRAGNIVVAVPGSAGREKAPVIVIQSHLDMVCEKNKGVDHDFDRDPIRTAVEAGWVVARGTTLGADNGIGVAAAMAAATDAEVVHGPLELLFTVDEETGLTGAANLDPALVTGRTLLNLDSEEDGVLCVGCSGGADTHLELELEREPAAADALPLLLLLSGLRGGHSGTNIHENRGNPIRLLARLLDDARRRGLDFAVRDLRGGDKSNAIPREAEAALLVPGAELDRWTAHVDRWSSELALELDKIEPDARVELHRDEDRGDPLHGESTARLLRVLLALPHGVLAMSAEIQGLVETSSNLASVRLDGNRATLVASSRSSHAPALESVRASIRAVGELAGAKCRVADAYPGWRPDPRSAVTAVLRDVYRDVWSAEPTVTAVHAGLECGLLGERIPGLDMISFGPTIEGAHSPDERVEIAAVERFWRALKLALDRLSS